MEKAKTLTKKPATSIETTDRKMETALDLWKANPDACKQDVVLRHILAKVTE
jgi:hypothetical protein